MYFWSRCYKPPDQVNGLFSLWENWTPQVFKHITRCVPQHFPSLFNGAARGIRRLHGFTVAIWNTALQLLYLKHSQVCSCPKCTLFSSLLTEYWDCIYQLWPTLLQGRTPWDSKFSGKYTILSLGMKVRLQHLSVWLLCSALRWRSVLKLLVCSSCSGVWFRSRSKIPVWGPRGSPPSSAGDLKQQELHLPSFNKAEWYVNPYPSITNSFSNPLAHIASSIWLCIFVPLVV